MIHLKVILSSLDVQIVRSVITRLKPFDEQVHVLSTNSAEKEVIYELSGVTDEAFQDLGKQCLAWVSESNSTILGYSMVNESSLS